MRDPTDEPDTPPAAGGLSRNSSLVAAGILLSRIAGLLREVVTAAFLGTGVAADAFKAALRIPNLLQNLLGEGVLSASFVPIYSQALAEGREEDAGRLAGAVAGLLLVVTSVLVLIGVVFARPITRVLAWGFPVGSERFELTVALVPIVTPGIGALVLSAWCLGILNSHGRFFLSYVTPVLWNVAIIAAVGTTALLITTDELPLATAMAWGAVAGSGMQLAVQLPAVVRSSRGLRLSISLAAPGVKTVLRRFGQVVTGRGGVQIGGYINLFLASLLAVGGVAALTYAQVLYMLPVALFGMSVAAAELPAISRMDFRDRPQALERLDAGLGRVAYFVVPSAVAFLVAGEHIVTLVLFVGRFSAGAVVQVGAILSVFGLALFASTSSRLLQSALYASGDARTPAVYAVIRVAASLIVGIALMFPLDAIAASPDGFEFVRAPRLFEVAPLAEREATDSLLRMGAAGLALGAVVGSWVELALLRMRIRVVFGRVRLGGPHARAIITGGLAAAAIGVLVRPLLGFAELPVRLDAVLILASIGITYMAVTRTQRVPEAYELLRLFRLGGHS